MNGSTDPIGGFTASPFSGQAMRMLDAWGAGMAVPSWPFDTVELSGARPMSSAELGDFFDRMRRLKQEALRQRALRGGAPSRPTDPNAPRETAAGPLGVRAHGYEKDGQYVPVRSVQVFEVGNYRNRTTQSFHSSWYEPEYSARLDKTKVGGHYRVVVTWADGTSRERDVRMDSPDGLSVDVWHY